MSVLMWEPRGKDAEGADTWIGVTVGITFLITKHKQRGIRLYKLEGGSKTLHGVGYTNTEQAKDAAERMVDV